MRNSSAQPYRSRSYDKWSHLIGVENREDIFLTEAMLRKWLNQGADRRIECIFCGRTYPVHVKGCDHCREYKGILPYIPEWSQWG